MHVWFLWATAASWTYFIVYWNSSFAPAKVGPDGKRIKQPWIRVQIARSPARAPPARESTAPPDPAIPSINRESAKSRSIHQLLVWAAILIAVVPCFYPLNLRFVPNPDWVASTGLAIQGAFAALYIWSRRGLGRNWSGQIQTTATHQLIRSGPYRVLGHPMYTAILGMFLGTALVWGQYHALLALAIATAAYVRKIRLEVRHLHGHFGSAYEAYQRESWALIPGII